VAPGEPLDADRDLFLHLLGVMVIGEAADSQRSGSRLDRPIYVA